jgi:hypothetical protein
MCCSWKVNHRKYVSSGDVWYLVNPITLVLISLPSRLCPCFDYRFLKILFVQGSLLVRVYLLLIQYISAAMLQCRLSAQPLSIRSFESMMFLCNSCQPMHFFWYTSTIGWLADTVVIFLISAAADPILLFCLTTAAHSWCIGNAHTILGFLLLADPSRF